MNKKIISIICIISILFSLSIYCSGHSGSTDSHGGHTDRSTGEYHYHHGYPAHQHEDGICPYDFDNNTEYHINSNNTESNERKTSNKYSDTNWLTLIYAIGILGVIYLLPPFIKWLIKKRADKSTNYKKPKENNNKPLLLLLIIILMLLAASLTFILNLLIDSGALL